MGENHRFVFQKDSKSVIFGDGSYYVYHWTLTFFLFPSSCSGHQHQFLGWFEISDPTPTAKISWLATMTSHCHCYCYLSLLLLLLLVTVASHCYCTVTGTVTITHHCGKSLLLSLVTVTVTRYCHCYCYSLLLLSLLLSLVTVTSHCYFSTEAEGGSRLIREIAF